MSLLYRGKRISRIRLRRTLSLFPCTHRQVSDDLPKVGDAIWCEACSEYRFVAELLTAWATDCMSCKYARFFDWDRGAAMNALDRHKNRNSGHTVVVFKNGRVMVTADSIRDTLPLGQGYALDADGDVIPF